MNCSIQHAIIRTLVAMVAVLFSWLYSTRGGLTYGYSDKIRHGVRYHNNMMAWNFLVLIFGAANQSGTDVGPQ